MMMMTLNTQVNKEISLTPYTIFRLYILCANLNFEMDYSYDSLHSRFVILTSAEFEIKFFVLPVFCLLYFVQHSLIGIPVSSLKCLDC